MSYKFTDAIWKIELRLPEKVVLLRMADYAGNDGGSIFPSVARVAKDCGLSDRAVQLILRKYVDEGLLVIVDDGGGRGKTRHYAMDLDRAQEMAGPAGEPKRAKRAKNTFAHSNGHDAAETVKRANDSALKGEEQIHPTLQGTVTEESKEESVCDVGVNPREAHTQAAPDSSGTRTAVVVPFQQPLPAEWVLPEAWRAWAQGAGQSGIDCAAQRFFDHHFERGVRKTEAGWEHAWRRWITENIERGYGNGQQRHAGRYGQRQDNGLVAYLKSEMQRNPGFAEDHQDDGDWRIIRG
jgi:hypothetical protein